MEDYYKLLGCERKASYEQLKEAYHRLVVKHHPDKNESADCKAVFQRIDRAWKTLRDPYLRKSYDNELKQSELNQGSLIYGTFTIKQLSYDAEERIYFHPCRCGGQYYFSKNDTDEFNSYLEKIMDSGKILKIKSELRHEILELLSMSDMKKLKKPEQPPDIILLNYLIKEYLNWLGYSYTSYMLSSESGIPHKHNTMSREQMEVELSLIDTNYDSTRPLLLQLIQRLKNE